MTLRADVRVRRGEFTLDASIEAEPGRTLTLLGPNGAGKSTLLGVLSGLVRPDDGAVHLNDTVLDDSRTGMHIEARERSAGIVFQDLLLFPHLSALENVAFPLRARGLSHSLALQRARAMLDRVGPATPAQAKPAELSGGQAQRVALARALVSDPDLLLLDEPLAALDIASRTTVRQLVAETLDRFEGIGVLVTHDPVDAMTLSDRIVIMEDGRITQRGTPAEIRDTPKSPYAADFVGVNLFRGRLDMIEPGVGRLVTASGSVIAGIPAGMDPGLEVLGILRPADVLVHTTRPEGSARNVLDGPVTAINIDGDRARVHIASSPPVTAEVTPASVSRLGLSRGGHVWASFKAVEVRVVPA